MFTSILIPTDGSKVSDRAVRQGLQLAHSLGAKVVAVHVTAPFHVLAASAAALTATREQCEKNAAAFSEAAEKHRCDAICMASHGRSGLAAMLIGGETFKVLTHSKVPVIVVR